MNCPKCNLTLLMTDRQGVEIDYCPQCRGIWLDRGELEKIIERNVSGGHADPYERRFQGEGEHGRHHDDHHDSHDRHIPYGQPGYRRKRGFLGDLFDF